MFGVLDAMQAERARHFVHGVVAEHVVERLRRSRDLGGEQAPHPQCAERAEEHGLLFDCERRRIDG